MPSAQRAVTNELIHHWQRVVRRAFQQQPPIEPDAAGVFGPDAQLNIGGVRGTELGRGIGHRLQLSTERLVDIDLAVLILGGEIAPADLLPSLPG